MNKNEFYDALRFKIVHNELTPGEVLNEKELMERYAIGRSPMREVLIRLQEEDLIQTIPRMGSVVTPLEIQKIRDIVELRREMELLVARLAAERVRSDQLARLRELLADARSVTRDDPVPPHLSSQYDTAFHDMLYDAAGNQTLKKFVQALNTNMIRLWYYLGYSSSGFLNQLDNVQCLIEAVAQHDVASAREAMQAHIDYFIEKVKSKIL